MAEHALAFLDALGLPQVDLLGFSLGGMVGQEIALARPSLVRKMLLVGTAPRGGEDIMHLEKPELKRILDDPNLPGLKDWESSSSHRAGRVSSRATHSSRGWNNGSRTGSRSRAPRWPGLRWSRFALGRVPRPIGTAISGR